MSDDDGDDGAVLCEAHGGVVDGVPAGRCSDAGGAHREGGIADGEG